MHIVLPIFSHVAFEAAQLSPFAGTIAYVDGVALGNTSVPPFWHTSVAVAVAVFWVFWVVPVVCVCVWKGGCVCVSQGRERGGREAVLIFIRTAAERL